MVSFKKGQSANEAAAMITILTFFLIVTLAAVSDDIIRASDENNYALLRDMADFLEEEARIAMSSENGYYHEFYLPGRLNNMRYEIGIINSTSLGSQTNVSLLFVSSIDTKAPLNVTKTLARNIRGNLEIGKTSVTKENGLVVIRSIPAPDILSIAPPSGPTSGGTIVTIMGNHFVDKPAVLFGGIPSSVTFMSSSELKAVTPPGSAGLVDVRVTNPDGQSSTLAAGFTYIPPAPTVLSAVPPSGPTSGDTTVVITGTDFVATPTVKFGDAASGSVTFLSSTEVRAVTPAHAAGLVDVRVTNPDGQSGTKTGGFTYTLPPPPTIASVSPKIGPSIGGTTVTITGNNFIATPSVKFGDETSGVVNFVNGNTLTAIVPASAGGAGFVDVTVTNPDGQSATRSNGFLYRLSLIPLGTAFVTSVGYNGNLGGLTGGDSKCQAFADAGSFGGTWKAWLSTASVNAKDRIPDTTYKRLDGKVIANNKADLLNPELSLVNPITIANDGRVTTGAVWTGTIFDGTYVGSPSWACSDWTSASGNGLYGDRLQTNYYWTWYAAKYCGASTSLYCFRTS